MSALDPPAPSFAPTINVRRLGGTRRLLLLAFGLIAVLSLLQVSQAGDATSHSYNIRRLDAERLEWDAKVRQLEADVAGLTSLDRIEREARERLGLKPARQRVYLEVPVTPPEEQLVPRRYIAPEGGEAAIDYGGEPWWRTVLGLLPFF